MEETKRDLNGASDQQRRNVRTEEDPKEKKGRIKRIGSEEIRRLLYSKSDTDRGRPRNRLERLKRLGSEEIRSMLYYESDTDEEHPGHQRRGRGRDVMRFHRVVY